MRPWSYRFLASAAAVAGIALSAAAQAQTTIRFATAVPEANTAECWG